MGKCRSTRVFVGMVVACAIPSIAANAQADDKIFYYQEPYSQKAISEESLGLVNSSGDVHFDSGCESCKEWRPEGTG